MITATNLYNKNSYKHRFRNTKTIKDNLIEYVVDNKKYDSTMDNAVSLLNTLTINSQVEVRANNTANLHKVRLVFTNHFRNSSVDKSKYKLKTKTLNRYTDDEFLQLSLIEINN